MTPPKMNGWSKIQMAILEILKDGQPHTREELHACCGPSTIGTVKLHLLAIRRKLPKEWTIASVRRNNVSKFVLVRLGQCFPLESN